MKKGFKKIKVFSIIVIIICIFWYAIGNTILKSRHIKINGFSIGLDDDKEGIQAAKVNVRPELLLVNREHCLSEDYIPKGLKIPNIPFSKTAENEEKHVATLIVNPLETLVAAARSEGIILLGNSGYRSYESQERTYNNRIKSQGQKLADEYVAKPGLSEHQTGLCIDLTNKAGYFLGSKEARWLAANCYRFGFIIRYPAEKKSITGTEYEPWHIRYVGKKAAKYIHDNGLTLEEYLEK